MPLNDIPGDDPEPLDRPDGQPEATDSDVKIAVATTEAIDFDEVDQE